MFADAPAPGAEWMVLVDGLDEIFDAGRRGQLIELLAHRVAEYSSQARYVITSRSLIEPEFAVLRGSLTGTDPVGRLGEYLLRPVDRPAVETFAGKWFQLRRGGQADRFSAGFLRSIDASGLDALVRIPLLATIAAAVYERRPDAPLPVDRTGLYERLLRTCSPAALHSAVHVRSFAPNSVATAATRRSSLTSFTTASGTAFVSSQPAGCTPTSVRY